MIKKIIFIALIVSTITSCKKAPEGGFEPVDRLNTYNYPTTYSNLETFLIPGYSNFRKSFNLYGFEYLTYHMASLEHSACLDYKDDTYWNELATHNITAPNIYVDHLWKGLYTGVKNMNVFLDRADFYENHYAKPTEITAIDQLRGEAYFLRAWYFFQLACFFNESYMTPTGGGDKRGVPLPTAIATNLEDASVGRSTVQQTWDQIISDLQLASVKLQGANRTGANIGRASEWAAKALLGKAYVFTGQYDLAKPILKDVINNSGKSLMPFNKYKNAYNALPESNEFNEESLFEINVERSSSTNNGIFASGTNPTDLTTSQGLIWGPLILGDDGYETGGNNIELSRVNIFVQDKNLRRFGFTLPVFDTVLAPGFTDPSTRTNPKFIMDPDYRTQSLNLRNTKAVDPRLYVCALEPWIDSVNNRIGTMRVPIARAGHLGNIYNTYGWSFKKYTTIDKSIYTYNSCDGANYYLLRLADVYLLYAEACKESGTDIADGLLYLNKVHRRAYDNYTGSSETDYASFNSTTKAAPADTKLHNDPIAYERFAEFFAEGQWWFDVCRWKIGASEQTYYQQAIADGTPIAPWQDKMYYYPIPSAELSSNKNLPPSQQSTGY